MLAAPPVAQVPLPLLGLGVPKKQMSFETWVSFPGWEARTPAGLIPVPKRATGPQQELAWLSGEAKATHAAVCSQLLEKLALWLQVAGGHAGAILEQGVVGWRTPELISRASPSHTSEPHSHAVQRLGLDVSLTWLEFVPLTSTHLYR